MAEPFLAEIRMIGFNFAPRGWATCDGQILPINQNQSLYSLLGTTYGGNGRTDFALPDLRGRTPIHTSGNHNLGTKGGQEVHALSEGEMPSHTHGMIASGDPASQPSASGNYLATPALAGGTVYSTTSETQDTELGIEAIKDSGTGQGHDNMQPYLAVLFCIALQGLFPSRN